MSHSPAYVNQFCDCGGGGMEIICVNFGEYNKKGDKKINLLSK